MVWKKALAFLGTAALLAAVAAAIVLTSPRRVRPWDETPATGLDVASYPAEGAPLASLAPAAFVLPDVSGLDRRVVARARAAGPVVDELTVEIGAAGEARILGVCEVRGWRGYEISELHPPPRGVRLGEVTVSLRPAGGSEDASGRVLLRVGDRDVKSLGELAKLLRGGRRNLDGLNVLVEAAPEAPWGAVCGVAAATFEETLPVLFAAPKGERPRRRPSRMLRIVLEARKRTDPDKAGALSTLAVRIRADARAPWRAVEGVLMVCVRANVFRLGLAVVADGRETVLVGRAPEYGLEPEPERFRFPPPE